MPFLPQEFLSNINQKGGLAKPSRFQVIIPIPTYIGSFINHTNTAGLRDNSQNVIEDVINFINSGNQSSYSKPEIGRYLSVQCETAELPGRTLQTLDAKVYGPIFKIPYLSQYSDTNLTFVCTNEFYERKLFDKWLEVINPTDTYNLRFPKGRDTRYLTNIKIVQYDELVKQVFAVELIDAFPTGISSQPLSWSEEGFHRLTVQIAYQKYKVIYEGSYDINQFLTSLVGSATAGQILSQPT